MIMKRAWVCQCAKHDVMMMIRINEGTEEDGDTSQKPEEGHCAGESAPAEELFELS